MDWKLAIGVAAAVLAACALAKTPDQTGGAGMLIVGNKGEDSVSFIDLATGREVARRETGPNPHEVAISPDGARAALVSYGGNGIDVFDIDKRELVRRIDLGANRAPHGIAWLDDGRIVVTTEGSDTLTVVAADLDRVSAIPTGQQGSHMVAASPDATRAYVVNMDRAPSPSSTWRKGASFATSRPARSRRGSH